jgi:hypothetical protein
VVAAGATSPIWTTLFGLPPVDGALDATRVIADGTPVVVDGPAGIVEL